jgi:S-adenosylmethionine decarboxylase
MIELLSNLAAIFKKNKTKRTTSVPARVTSGPTCVATFSKSNLLIDLWGVSSEMLDDTGAMAVHLESSAREGGAVVLESHFHRFAPQGLSGVVILSQSHIAIHTWPELGFAAIDVFTCGDSEMCSRIADVLVTRLDPERHERRAVERGEPRNHREGLR